MESGAVTFSVKVPSLSAVLLRLSSDGGQLRLDMFHFPFERHHLGLGAFEFFHG